MAMIVMVDEQGNERGIVGVRFQPDDVTIGLSKNLLALKDNAVGTPNLGAGAVTAAKLSYTLNLSSDSYPLGVKTPRVP